LAELLIVVAIIGVLVAISIPIFTTQLEKSREATDLANIRSAYAMVAAEMLTNPDEECYVEVKIHQKKAGWQTKNVTLPGNLHDCSQPQRVDKSYNESISGEEGYRAGVAQPNKSVYVLHFVPNKWYSSGFLGKSGKELEDLCDNDVFISGNVNQKIDERFSNKLRTLG